MLVMMKSHCSDAGRRPTTLMGVCVLRVRAAIVASAGRDAVSAVPDIWKPVTCPHIFINAV